MMINKVVLLTIFLYIALNLTKIENFIDSGYKFESFTDDDAPPPASNDTGGDGTGVGTGGDDTSNVTGEEGTGEDPPAESPPTEDQTLSNIKGLIEGISGKINTTTKKSRAVKQIQEKELKTTIMWRVIKLGVVMLFFLVLTIRNCWGQCWELTRPSSELLLFIVTAVLFIVMSALLSGAWEKDINHGMWKTLLYMETFINEITLIAIIYGVISLSLTPPTAEDMQPFTDLLKYVEAFESTASRSEAESTTSDRVVKAVKVAATDNPLHGKPG